MTEELGEAHSVRLVDRELLPSAERDLQRDAGAGEVGVYASVIARSVSFSSCIVSAPDSYIRAARMVPATAVKDSSPAGTR